MKLPWTKNKKASRPNPQRDDSWLDEMAGKVKSPRLVVEIGAGKVVDTDLFSFVRVSAKALGFKDKDVLEGRFKIFLGSLEIEPPQ